MSGVTVSALTAPANPENKPAASDADGKFTLEVKHEGTFKLAVGNTACYDDLTTADINASADGSHDAGAIGLTAKPEPTGTDRYTFTLKSPPGGLPANKKFKLTVNCLREIPDDLFNAAAPGTIISGKAADEGVGVANASGMITEISLPPTLTKIGNNAFKGHRRVLETLTVPRHVQTIGNNAFEFLGTSLFVSQYVMVKFESGSRLKTIGQQAFQGTRLRDFMLPENLESIGPFAFFNAEFAFISITSETLTIPAKVSKIGNRAFSAVPNNPRGLTVVEILSDVLRKPSTTAVAPFPLGNDLFQGRNGITEIRLPQAVHDSYTAPERLTIFRLSGAGTAAGISSLLKPR